jgi:hypothetical protein
VRCSSSCLLACSSTSTHGHRSPQLHRGRPMIRLHTPGRRACGTAPNGPPRRERDRCSTRGLPATEGDRRQWLRSAVNQARPTVIAPPSRTALVRRCGRHRRSPDVSPPAAGPVDAVIARRSPRRSPSASTAPERRRTDSDRSRSPLRAHPGPLALLSAADQRTLRSTCFLPSPPSRGVEAHPSCRMAEQPPVRTTGLCVGRESRRVLPACRQCLRGTATTRGDAK